MLDWYYIHSYISNKQCNYYSIAIYTTRTALLPTNPYDIKKSTMALSYFMRNILVVIRYKLLIILDWYYIHFCTYNKQCNYYTLAIYIVGTAILQYIPMVSRKLVMAVSYYISIILVVIKYKLSIILDWYYIQSYTYNIQCNYYTIVIYTIWTAKHPTNPYGIKKNPYGVKVFYEEYANCNMV